MLSIIMNARIFFLDVLALLCQASFVLLNFVLAGFALRGHHYTFYYLFVGLAGLTLSWFAARTRKAHADQISSVMKLVHVVLLVFSMLGFVLGLLLSGWVVYAFVLTSA
jgi:hypothetical protein